MVVAVVVLWEMCSILFSLTTLPIAVPLVFERFLSKFIQKAIANSIYIK
jgi:hypothetical protein